MDNPMKMIAISSILKESKNYGFLIIEMKLLTKRPLVLKIEFLTAAIFEIESPFPPGIIENKFLFGRSHYEIKIKFITGENLIGIKI